MTIAIVAVLLGIIGRTVLPYLQEVRDNVALKFDRQFFVPALASILIALVTSPFVVAAIPADQLSIIEITPPLFAGLFVAAWGATDILRQGQKLYQSFTARPSGVITPKNVDDNLRQPHG